MLSLLETCFVFAATILPNLEKEKTVIKMIVINFPPPKNAPKMMMMSKLGRDRKKSNINFNTIEILPFV